MSTTRGGPGLPWITRDGGVWPIAGVRRPGPGPDGPPARC